MLFILCLSRLLRALLSYELVKKGYTAYSWKDNFSRETLGILAQHAIQSKMSRNPFQTNSVRHFENTKRHFENIICHFNNIIRRSENSKRHFENTVRQYENAMRHFKDTICKFLKSTIMKIIASF